MPESRLQRTREAYRRKPSIVDGGWPPEYYMHGPDDGLNPAVVGIGLAVIVFAGYQVLMRLGLW